MKKLHLDIAALIKKDKGEKDLPSNFSTLLAKYRYLKTEVLIFKDKNYFHTDSDTYKYLKTKILNLDRTLNKLIKHGFIRTSVKNKITRYDFISESKIADIKSSPYISKWYKSLTITQKIWLMSINKQYSIFIRPNPKSYLPRSIKEWKEHNWVITALSLVDNTSQNKLAKLLGVTRETVNKNLKRCKKLKITNNFVQVSSSIFIDTNLKDLKFKLKEHNMGGYFVNHNGDLVRQVPNSYEVKNPYKGDLFINEKSKYKFLFNKMIRSMTSHITQKSYHHCCIFTNNNGDKTIFHIPHICKVAFERLKSRSKRAKSDSVKHVSNILTAKNYIKLITDKKEIPNKLLVKTHKKDETNKNIIAQVNTTKTKTSFKIPYGKLKRELQTLSEYFPSAMHYCKYTDQMKCNLNFISGASFKRATFPIWRNLNGVKAQHVKVVDPYLNGLQLDNAVYNLQNTEIPSVDGRYVFTKPIDTLAVMRPQYFKQYVKFHGKEDINRFYYNFEECSKELEEELSKRQSEVAEEISKKQFEIAKANLVKSNKAYLLSLRDGLMRDWLDFQDLENEIKNSIKKFLLSEHSKPHCMKLAQFLINANNLNTLEPIKIEESLKLFLADDSIPSFRKEEFKEFLVLHLTSFFANLGIEVFKIERGAKFEELKEQILILDKTSIFEEGYLEKILTKYLRTLLRKHSLFLFEQENDLYERIQEVKDKDLFFSEFFLSSSQNDWFPLDLTRPAEQVEGRSKRQLRRFEYLHDNSGSQVQHRLYMCEVLGHTTHI